MCVSRVSQAINFVTNPRADAPAQYTVERATLHRCVSGCNGATAKCFYICGFKCYISNVHAVSMSSVHTKLIH